MTYRSAIQDVWGVFLGVGWGDKISLKQRDLVPPPNPEYPKRTPHIFYIYLFTAIGLLPGGSGYFTCNQNVKLVTTRF